VNRCLPFVLLLAACSASPVNTDTAALRATADSRSKSEIENVLSSALDGASITIADDALTRESTLIIERGMHRSVDRNPVLGRDLGRPNHFRLVLDARQCFLVHEETGLRWMLNETECVAE
jgi:hypothetical protein